VGGGAAVCAPAGGAATIVATTEQAQMAARKPSLPGFLLDNGRLFTISFCHGLDESQTIRLKPGQARQD
jgi:hypothetical protein